MEAWQNIISVVFKNKKDLRTLLTDENTRIRIQFFGCYIILSLVSFVMVGINIATGYFLLMYGVLSFALGNLINLGLSLINSKLEKFTHYLLAAEIISLFTFFTITGEPDGFPIIWLLLLPTCGLLLYGRKYGSVLSGILFAILLFLLWTPWGQKILMYDYSDAIDMRFPVLYVSFYCVGFLFELIRHFTQVELAKARNQYRTLYVHDALTGLYNRYGFNALISQTVKEKSKNGFAFMILDLDHFKHVNDKFGHLNGDLVLKSVAEDINILVGNQGKVCRWGGEEFAIIIDDVNIAEDLGNKILESRRNTPFQFEKGSKVVTISIGLVIVSGGENLQELEVVSLADDNLYNAKKSGRNTMVVSSYYTK